MNFANANYAPGVGDILSNALTGITPQKYTPFMPQYDPRKVAIGYALRAAERIHLKDWQIEELMDAMEAQMEYGNPEEMLGSDAVEVYERYEAYRQAERDELERMEAQEEYDYELKQAIEGSDSYASLEAS